MYNDILKHHNNIVNEKKQQQQQRQIQPVRHTRVLEWVINFLMSPCAPYKDDGCGFVYVWFKTASMTTNDTVYEDQ